MGPSDWFMQQYNAINSGRPLASPPPPQSFPSPMMAQQPNMMRSPNPGGASFAGNMPGNPLQAQMAQLQTGMQGSGSPYGPAATGMPGQMFDQQNFMQHLAAMGGGLLGQGGTQNPAYASPAQMPGMNMAMGNSQQGPQSQAGMGAYQGPLGQQTMMQGNLQALAGMQQGYQQQQPNANDPRTQMMSPQMMMQRYNGFGG